MSEDEYEINKYIKDAQVEYADADYAAAQISMNMSIAFSLHQIAEHLSLIEIHLDKIKRSTNE